MKKIIVILGVVVVGIGLLAVPALLRPQQEVIEAPLPVVEVLHPRVNDIYRYRQLIGIVEPSEVVYISPFISGEVTQVHVNVGDYVTKGQVICSIDNKQLDAAKIALEGASIAVTDARKNLDRQRVLYQAGDLAPAAFEQVESQVKSAQIQYDNAKLNYDNQLEFSDITANIDGIIESLDVKVYDIVSPQNRIAVVAGHGGANVTFSVPETIVNNLSVGQEITIGDNEDQKIGIIAEIGTAVDAATGLFKIEATLDDGDGFATGTSVKLEVISERAEQVLAIPSSCVYYAQGNPFVYLHEDGVMKRTDIEVGLYDEENIQVVSGLNIDSEIIATWSSELFDGSRVQLVGESETIQDSQLEEQSMEQEES